MTPQQKRLYDIIKAELDASGVCPSFEEMREAMGLKAKSNIYPFVIALEKQGYIRRLPHRARCIEITAKQDPTIPAVRAALREQATEWVIKAAKGIRPTNKGPAITIPEDCYRELVSALRKLRAV